MYGLLWKNRFINKSFNFYQGIQMGKQIFLVFFIFVTSVFFVLPLHADQEYKAQYRQIELGKKKLQEISSNINKLRSEKEDLSSDLDIHKRQNEINREEYEEAKKKYTRAAKNVDIISHKRLSELLNNLNNSREELRKSKSHLKKLEGEKKQAVSSLARLKRRKISKEIEVLEIEAEIYESSLKKGVWVEGFGECILDENKSMKTCKQLARQYAERDAIEKGGKSILESITEIKNFELTKDVIKKNAKVNIVSQDNSGDYGKVKRVISGDIIKFVVNIRVKIESVSTFSPFRARIKELKRMNSMVAVSKKTVSVPDKEPNHIDSDYSSKEIEKNDDFPENYIEGLPSELKKYANMLQSNSIRSKISAAKKITRAKISDVRLLDIVEAKLLNGYNLKDKNRHHVDFMAWLCKALGQSGVKKYEATLEKVAKDAKNRKLRKYASKSLKVLK